MKLRPCGTEAAYRRHRYNGEVPCDECRTAHTNYLRDGPPKLPPLERDPCGTPGAYRRHLRRGEVTCRACCDAWSKSQAGTRRRPASRHEVPAELAVPTLGGQLQGPTVLGAVDGVGLALTVTDMIGASLPNDAEQ